MDVWRLLGLEVGDAFTNMAMDEAILTARIAGKVPNTLRFYRWKPSAVSIGRFQDLFSEVHVENCRKHGVDVVRRITGGGAVYHDYDGEITYSLVVDGKDLGYADMDLISAYKTVCKGLIEAVRILGTVAEFNPLDSKQCPNITIKGKKISGSAQSYKRGILLQHGTFLVDINHEKMFTFLKVPWAKTLVDVLEVSKKKLTSAQQELELRMSMEEAYQALVKGFEKALKIQLTEEELTSYEWKLAEKIRRNKFSTEDWNFNGKAVVLS
ncbi:MAG: lipoate--protein ligase family protein [Candidatus Bathyarchaeota archaeon]|nr:lipoate--protein ligase family protein [Candidatus Bathyarchaeota archaeon]MDH5419405.1 lipoate--protein ligase family protein [Candidatus Bathyarchaeota archaeon]MDH5623781.1 lipoate--protein ligase family protein [Candidatus Bathyarchaeota archaeon]MDH5635693.1 lipoate--protein ligase family protein [Candidatus Bathyarchaeota archaeon]MDH5701235.1 lipoate--protein ligase family protein [Candidatus Bathyarchaeota archaeon]